MDFKNEILCKLTSKFSPGGPLSPVKKKSPKLTYIPLNIIMIKILPGKPSMPCSPLFPCIPSGPIGPMSPFN